MNKKKHRIIKPILRLAFFLLVLFLAIWLSKLAKDSDLLRDMVMTYGYGAIFGISTLSGFNLIIPIPAVSFLPLFIESGLDFWLTLMIISFGMTIADSVVYFLGRAGREFSLSAMQTKWFNRLDRWRDRNYWWPIIIFAMFVVFAPLPNEIIIIPLALLGYKLKHLFWILLFGNFIFNLLFAGGLLHLI